MNANTNDIAVEIAAYQDLLAHLYRLANEYEKSFRGITVGADDRDQIIVTVDGGNGKTTSYSFVHRNDSAIRSFRERLAQDGFLDNSHFRILPDRAVEYVRARSEAQQQRERDERIGGRRRRVWGFWIPLVLVLISVSLSIFLSYILARHDNRAMESRIDTLERAIQELAPPSTEPATQPAD